MRSHHLIDHQGQSDSVFFFDLSVRHQFSSSDNPPQLCLDSSCHTNPCLSHPCLFNGTCLWKSNETNYTCACPEGLTGQRCEYDLHGDTSAEFALDMQSKSSETSLINTTDLWPLAIVFGYIFSLMLVFIIIWFLW